MHLEKKALNNDGAVLGGLLQVLEYALEFHARTVHQFKVILRSCIQFPPDFPGWLKPSEKALFYASTFSG